MRLPSFSRMPSAPGTQPASSRKLLGAFHVLRQAAGIVGGNSRRSRDEVTGGLARLTVAHFDEQVAVDSHRQGLTHLHVRQDRVRVLGGRTLAFRQIC